MPKKDLAAHPMQPVLVDEHGVHRFHQNAIVRYMLDEGTRTGLFDLNKFATLPFSREDHEQLAQLIGYSVGGFAELSYVSDEAYEAAKRQSVALRRKGK